MIQRTAQAVINAGVLSGPTLPGFAQALGTALEAWSHTWVIQGQAVGSGVAGNVTGTLTLAPSPVSYAAVPLGLTGSLASQLAIVTNLGVSAGVTGVVYRGVSPTVGTGIDVSRVVGDPSILASLLMSAFVAAWGSEGMTASLTASWLAPAIASHLALALGAGVVGGSVTPTPSAGLTLSRVGTSP